MSHLIKKLLKQVALRRPLMSTLRKRRVISNFILQVQSHKPPIPQMRLHFFA